MKKPTVAATVSGLVLVLALLLLGSLLGSWAWQQRESAPSPAAAVPASAPATLPPPLPLPAPSPDPGIKHPIAAPAAAVSPASGAARATALDPTPVLSAVFGRQSVLRLFQLDDFAHRLVATVDNLGREHAPARLWPLNPASRPFLTAKSGDVEVISRDNAVRYLPYVRLIETVDLNRLASAYARLYPLFQQAYEELGYPKRYFNDRLVEVLDLLIATPEPAGPITVWRPTLSAPVQPPRPWVLYEFEDPALQSLTAGQRILLRTGASNERRLKVRLVELRRLLATGAQKQ